MATYGPPRRRICSYPGCRAVTVHGRCVKHTPRRPPVNRVTMSDQARVLRQFLDSAVWRRMSAAKLREEPNCELCGGAGYQVDHILPRRTHPHLALQWSNLQTVCERCHGKKTRRGE